MQKVLVVTGPTAVGKTNIGVELAQKLNGAVISADSIQVYKGLDIISGKDLPQNPLFRKETALSSKEYNIGCYDFGDAPVFLLDVVSPFYNFSVSDFVKTANSVLDLLQKESRLPIVVGGTGFYVNGLFNLMETINVARDENLRKKLENKNVSELQEILIQKNKKKFDSMNNSDRNNPQRLIRAIEVAQQARRSSHVAVRSNNYDVLFIGLKCDRDELKKRIDIRVEERLKNGALKEVKVLFKNYKLLSSSVKNANGYRQLFEYCNGEISFEQALQKWKNSEYLHAKNQMTWFLKDKRISWFDIKDEDFDHKLEEFVIAWYNKSV